MIFNEIPEVWCWSCHDYGLIETWDLTGNIFTGYGPCHCKPAPRYIKFTDFWRVSREVWIDSPKDKARKTLTEAPF